VIRGIAGLLVAVADTVRRNVAPMNDRLAGALARPSGNAPACDVTDPRI